MTYTYPPIYFIIYLFTFFFFFTVLCDLWDLTSLTWDRTWDPLQYKCGGLTSGLQGNSLILYILTEKAMAPHSSTLAWKIPWTKEPGRLQSMGSLRVGHDWETSLSLFTFMHWRRKWQSTPVFLPGGSQGWGSRAAVYGVAQSWTRLKRLSIYFKSSLNYL